MVNCRAGGERRGGAKKKAVYKSSWGNLRWFGWVLGWRGPVG